MTASVLIERREGVAWVTLNRPERLNALTPELLDELLEILEQIASDTAVTALVLTGAGRGFCAGGDLSDADAKGKLNLEDSTTQLRRQSRCSELLYDMDKVTVAAINGACAGAGLSLACAADVRIASSSAVFKTSFVSAGMSGDFGGAWLLSGVVGAARAKELFFLNEKLNATDALHIGLVSEVVENEIFELRVREVASLVAGWPPLAVRGMKRNLNEAHDRSFSEALDAEAPRHIATAMSHDAAEAGSAFLEKRLPSFEGR